MMAGMAHNENFTGARQHLLTYAVDDLAIGVEEEDMVELGELVADLGEHGETVERVARPAEIVLMNNDGAAVFPVKRRIGEDEIGLVMAGQEVLFA